MKSTILFLLFIICAPYIQAADVSINWSPPTENVDGTPLTDLAGYKVYAGTSARDYQTSTPINDASLTSAVVPIALTLMPGENRIFLAMTALDADGNESAYSNEISRLITVIDNIAPNAPVIITITIEIGIDCPSGVTCNVVNSDG